ncbi:hypothetical protein DCW30_05690 [Streptomyces alfalfae]|uniref:Uncharacterized protein n=1 Tax=Streptomyces alfalfae TaxID=1642299 RepID=A0ABM6GXR2_9ACTN|nr:hypothetical protein [Streptomyces alfalfae]APY88207.1 hypothetical protein A7J05_23185 [Streptomyces alfalfae]AYA18602.1 hypothetical protein D3X13_22295 [Streptomyces fradiae]RXX46518.1 hypothetical protein DCW30_05690 [Streptomyces alfalfae]RZM90031.1 hypothetical protein D4104_25625 [Streptomyces alfalfae]
MGYYHSAYFAYGIHIPVDNQAAAWAESERLDKELKKHKQRCPDVGHLSAGDYDHDRLFLVTKSDEIPLGQYGRASTTTPEQRANWNLQLANAVHALGYSDIPDLEAPGWLCIPDLS